MGPQNFQMFVEPLQFCFWESSFLILVVKHHNAGGHPYLRLRILHLPFSSDLGCLSVFVCKIGILTVPPFTSCKCVASQPPIHPLVSALRSWLGSKHFSSAVSTMLSFVSRGLRDAVGGRAFSLCICIMAVGSFSCNCLAAVVHVGTWASLRPSQACSPSVSSQGWPGLGTSLLDMVQALCCSAGQWTPVPSVCPPPALAILHLGDLTPVALIQIPHTPGLVLPYWWGGSWHLSALHARSPAPSFPLSGVLWWPGDHGPGLGWATQGTSLHSGVLSPAISQQNLNLSLLKASNPSQVIPFLGYFSMNSRVFFSILPFF